MKHTDLIINKLQDIDLLVKKIFQLQKITHSIVNQNLEIYFELSHKIDLNLQKQVINIITLYLLITSNVERNIELYSNNKHNIKYLINPYNIKYLKYFTIDDKSLEILTANFNSDVIKIVIKELVLTNKFIRKIKKHFELTYLIYLYKKFISLIMDCKLQNINYVGSNYFIDDENSLKETLILCNTNNHKEYLIDLLIKDIFNAQAKYRFEISDKSSNKLLKLYKVNIADAENILLKITTKKSPFKVILLQKNKYKIEISNNAEISKYLFIALKALLFHLSSQNNEQVVLYYDNKKAIAIDDECIKDFKESNLLKILLRNNFLTIEKKDINSCHNYEKPNSSRKNLSIIVFTVLILSFITIAITEIHNFHILQDQASIITILSGLLITILISTYTLYIHSNNKISEISTNSLKNEEHSYCF